MPYKRYYRQTKLFSILDKIEKKELIFNSLKGFKNGTTGYELARKVGCTPDTIYRHLNYFHNKGLIRLWRMGKFKVYAPKDNGKYFNIRNYLEKEFEKEEERKKEKKRLKEVSLIDLPISFPPFNKQRF